MITFPSWLRSLRKSLKARWIQLHIAYVQRFRSYGREDLLRALRELGVRKGDALMLHSAFSPQHGFRGSIEQLTDTFIEALGADGHLLMVSLPYRSSSIAYLEKLKHFDVRRTPSMMGLVSEFFRRRPAVLRSLHPTHPILVHGPRAEAIIAGHENCVHPCGPGTPFDHLAQADGLVVFLNVDLETFTFFHYLEHRVSQRLPFPLYTDTPFDVPVIDRNGAQRTVRTHVYTREAIGRRRFGLLVQALEQRGAIHRVRVGHSRLAAIRVREAIACVDEMAARGEFFYDFTALDGEHVAHPIQGA